jgi:hypothetical protein
MTAPGPPGYPQHDCTSRMRIARPAWRYRCSDRPGEEDPRNCGTAGMQSGCGYCRALPVGKAGIMTWFTQGMAPTRGHTVVTLAAHRAAG